MFWACQDDAISEAPEPQPDPETSTELYYLAVRLYNSATIEGGSTRADQFHFDSEGDDYEQSGHEFNIGYADESRIYTDFEKPEDSPHFLLVFAADGSSLDYILPLADWDYETNGDVKDNNSTSSNNTSGYHQYHTFYTSAQKSSIPMDFMSRKFLVVLNCSDALKEKLTAAHLAKQSFDEVRQLTVGGNNPSNTDFIFMDKSKTMKDDAGEDVTVTTRYFTMTSSMVLYANEEGGIYNGPAEIRRQNFNWKPTKAEAVKEPVFSFFLERLQAKFTLMFEKTDGLYYYLTTDTNILGGKDSNDKEYVPVQHLILTPGVDFDFLSNKLTFRYVSHYERNDAISDVDEMPVDVKTTENWKMNIVGWGVNGVQKEEYAFKQLNQLNDAGLIDGYYYDGWNPTGDLKKYRNFWAEGFNYGINNKAKPVYPDQFRTADNHEDIGIQPAVNLNPLYGKQIEQSLIYRPYTSFTKRNIEWYAPEHTYDPSIYALPDPEQGKEHLRAGTHIIIAAQLLLGPTDDSKTGTTYDGLDQEDYYRQRGTTYDNNGMLVKVTGTQTYPVACKLQMNDIFWDEEAYKTFVVEYLGYFMLTDANKKIFGNTDGIFYVDDQVGDAANRPTADGSFFELGHLNMKHGDNMVYVIPAKDPQGITANDTKLYVWDVDNNEFTDKCKDGTTTINEAFTRLSLQHQEYFAKHFKAGMMYFAVPVYHQPNSLYKDLGKFGVVRNHWYNFVVKNIRNIGTAVDRDNEEIVPNNQPLYEALGVNLSIYPWHDISTDVDISGQRPAVSTEMIDLDLKANDWKYEGREEEF